MGMFHMRLRMGVASADDQTGESFWKNVSLPGKRQVTASLNFALTSRTSPPTSFLNNSSEMVRLSEFSDTMIDLTFLQ